MTRKSDYVRAWFNQLKKEDQINQALLELSRNESRILYMYDRVIRLTPPLVSVSNNAETVHQLNDLIKESIHQIIDEQGYLDHLIQNVPFSDIQQVILDEHIQEEKLKLHRWIDLLNVLVSHVYDVRNPKRQQIAGDYATSASQ